MTIIINYDTPWFLMAKDYFVYIVECCDGSLYTGVTNDVTSRVSQHSLGVDPRCYTFKRRPVKLVYSSCFSDVNEAIAWEHRVKRWSRKKKEALIKENWDELKRKSKCMNESHFFIDKPKKKSRHSVMVRQAHHDKALSSRA